LRSLKTKFALTGAALGLLLVIGLIAFATALRGPAGGVLWVAIGISLVASGVAAWLAFAMGRRITSVLEQLNDSTHRMAEGDFTQPVRVVRNDELGDLQRTVDLMRKSLADTTITKNYLDNVLNSMVDAVRQVASGIEGSIRCNSVSALLPAGDRGSIVTRPRTAARLSRAADVIADDSGSRPSGP
jgi:methyl-accepting chemotaxis protein